jgi:SAM-dependent methyltransferase
MAPDVHRPAPDGTGEPVNTFDAEWRARFERFGQAYTEEHEVSGWSAEGLARRFKLFEGLVSELPIPKGADILELGCGAGTYVRYLAGLGHSVIGVDYARPSLGRAIEADRGRKARYVAADGYDLPFRPASFDLVLCIGVLQALSRPERILDEISRVMRSGGLVVVEALNALELPAMAKRLRELVSGRPPRLHAHPPSRVRRWLEERSTRPVRMVGVYLPPRRFPWLGRLLDQPVASALLEHVPATAHAFWLVGQKST